MKQYISEAAYDDRIQDWIDAKAKQGWTVHTFAPVRRADGHVTVHVLMERAAPTAFGI